MYPKYHYIGGKIICKDKPIAFPPQHQDRMPGLEYVMEPRPISENPDYRSSDRLKGRVAIITGGDSGIGRAVAYAYAKEKADIAIAYLNEDKDAEETKKRIEELGQSCIVIPGDLREENHSHKVVEEVMHKFGHIDILVNNIGIGFYKKSILDISAEQLDETFRTNIYSFFFMTKAALPNMKSYSSIINTASVTAYEGEKNLLDYSAAKGAVVAFTRSLSLSLESQHIRVNAVAPGYVWTPLIPAGFPADKVMTFGTDVPMKRAAQPFELAPAYVYLASDDSRYVSGQVIHVNGGIMVSS